VKEKATQNEQFPDCEIRMVQEEYTETIEHRKSAPNAEQYIEYVPVKKQVTEVQGTEKKSVLKTRTVKKTRTERRTKVEERRVTRRIPKHGIWAAIRRWWTDEKDGYIDVIETENVPVSYDVEVPYTEEENYTDYIDVPRIVTKEVTEMVPVVRTRTTMKEEVTYEKVTRTRSVQVVVNGIRSRTKELYLTGTQKRGWELKAKWQDPEWDKVDQKVLKDEFTPSN
jgi:hypothetical protein